MTNTTIPTHSVLQPMTGQAWLQIWKNRVLPYNRTCVADHSSRSATLPAASGTLLSNKPHLLFSCQGLTVHTGSTNLPNQRTDQLRRSTAFRPLATFPGKGEHNLHHVNILALARHSATTALNAVHLPLPTLLLSPRPHGPQYISGC